MRTLSIIKHAFSIVGLGFLIGAAFSYKNTQDFLSDALTAKGTVIELAHSTSSDSTTYKPVVVFKTKDGSLVEFTSSSGNNPPRYSKGEIVEVLYPEHMPKQARINGYFALWGMATIIGAMGVIFFLIGFSIFLVGHLKTRKIEYLRNNGTKVNTKFQSVEANGALEVNGRNPYQIYTQWENPKTSELHLFKSENIWFDPTNHIDRDEIIVLIERNNPKKYYVDISFLPKLAS